MAIEYFRGEYAFLSNFTFCNIAYDGIAYPTTEHAFQASKTLDMDIRKEIAALSNPPQAKKYGRNIDLRSDWFDISLNVMYDVNKLKFSQPEFKALLLATGDEEIAENNNWNDTFWGKCNGRGENHLGKILMHIRNELKS